MMPVPVKQTCYGCGKEDGYPSYAVLNTRNFHSYNLCRNCYNRIKRQLEKDHKKIKES